MNFHEIQEEKLQEKKLIGSGGFGEVYKAWHVDWGHHVALKRLNSKFAQHSKEQLLLEAQKMLCALGIDHVLRIYGLCKCSDNSLVLVMEYMENGSLSRLQQLVKPLPWPLKFRALHEVNLGMNRLHDLCPSLLHLDLKPQNILLNKDLHIKISDFGLSRFKRGITLPQDVPPADGTLEYMAPELFNDINCPPTKASDVYSYAILIWCVLKGEEPFSNCIQTTREIFKAHEHHEDKAICEVWETLKKMETSSDQERWEAPSYRPPSTALNSSPTSGIVENFKTLTLEQPPSHMNEAVPLSDLSIKMPHGYNSTFQPPLKPRTQEAQEKIPDVTPQLPLNGPEFPKTPVSSAHQHIGTPLQTAPQRHVPQVKIIGSASHIQIGNNNTMEIHHRTRKNKTKR
uniref:Receptor-interacting serine/threonine-protein kinase 3 isoform X3 n=1 Tax=Geotrypetes seraphini TaxID=260995 RepID=A0A6P8PIJ0_GEOSA|nr:receptor-interacting serine/threonine-protein kinase 3 isoform X3 [Geotrypetes seraphini]